MNSRRTFLASLAALVPVLGSKAFANGTVKPALNSTINFVNNTGLPAQMVISPTINATTVFTTVNPATSLTSTAKAYSATTLAAQLVVADPQNQSNKITLTTSLAVKYPNLGVKTATYNLNYDAVANTISIAKV